MIELKKTSKPEYFDVVIDGKSYDKVYAFGNENCDYHSNDKAASQQLINHKLKEFPLFAEIWLENVFDWIEFENLLWIRPEYVSGQVYNFRTGNLRVSINFEPLLLNWDKNYSFKEYADLFGSLFNANEQFGEFNFFEKVETPTFSIDFEASRFETTITEFIKPCVDKLREINEIVLNELSAKVKNESVTTSFNFPDEIKYSCKQYLEYFAKFLQDLGVNATSNLHEEAAGKVLFSVIPTDDKDALDKIRESLAVYLNLPSSPIVYDDSFAAMRLQQEIEKLQYSQRLAEREIRSGERELRLAQTVIEHQDKIIAQKDSIIEQNNKIIEKITSKSIMMDSLENKEELEEIYDGLKIGESKFLKENLGIHLNPAKLVKSGVKNIFGKDDKKSILGLDEENDK